MILLLTYVATATQAAPHENLNKTGFLGLIVLVLIAVAVYLMVRARIRRKKRREGNPE